MEDKLTLEYFLSLLDEGERIIKGDFFSEKVKPCSYELKDKEVKVDIKEEIKDDSISSCRNCPAWRNRIKYIPPVTANECKLMCILASPERMAMLSPAADDYFKKWCSAIGLPLENVSLTTLIKCPSEIFSKEYADMCKPYLREEMQMSRPKVLLLLGQDVASYMLRKNLPIESLRGRRYIINNIATYVTYSPKDLVANRSLRVPIWEDLKLLKEAL